jgi:hypothetical protein
MNLALSIALRATTAALLFWAVAPHRYGYFQLLRVVVTASALMVAWQERPAVTRESSAWVWCFVGCAILFNPLFPVGLSRGAWRVVDIAAGALFVATIWRTLDRRRKRPRPHSSVPTPNSAAL